MGRSVLDGHVLLDTGEELVEAHIEALEEDGQSRDRWERTTAFDGADERPRERVADLALGQVSGAPPAPQLASDGHRQGVVAQGIVARLLQNN
jgi:hypothetical protein